MTGFYEGTGGAVEPIPHDLNFHEDVFITDPQDGQIIVYNGTTELWENIDDTADTVELAFGELTDVDFNSPLDGQVAAFNATTQTWVNVTLTGDAPPLELTDLIDVTITDPTQNDRLVYDGGLWVNTGSSTTLENPVTIGTGADDTAATLILNAGATPSTDYARVEYQNGSVLGARQGTNLSADGSRAQFYTAVVAPGEVDPTLVSLIWSNPDTPTLTEFALANKTQFRIYKGTGTTANDRELESFGQGTTANGLRIIDALTGQEGCQLASTDTTNSIILNRKGVNTPAIALRTGSADNTSSIELDGKLNFTGANSSGIQKDGVSKINFDDADKIKMYGSVWVETALQIHDPAGGGYYNIINGNFVGINLLNIYPDFNNSGFLLRSRSTTGAYYDLFGGPTGVLTWRDNPVAMMTDVVDKAKVRDVLIGLADILNITPPQRIALQNYLLAELGV